jgi:hypothetical protein
METMKVQAFIYLSQNAHGPFGHVKKEILSGLMHAVRADNERHIAHNY